MDGVSLPDTISLPPVGGLCEAGPMSTDAFFHDLTDVPAQRLVLHGPVVQPVGVGGTLDLSPDTPADEVFDCLSILHCNIRGWLSHRDEFLGHISLAKFPSLLFLNETLLDDSVQHPSIPNYELIGRHEHASSRRGVAAYAHYTIAPDAVLLKKSADTERMWFLLHTQLGPFLLCCWYRRPDRGETSSITSLRSEYHELKGDCVGTVLVGDLNVHHRQWLEFSSENTPEGFALHNFCQDHGFSEFVRAPTRGDYMLDVVLSDLHLDIDTAVLAGVSDHSIVLAKLQTKIQIRGVVSRQVWKYEAANWSELRRSLSTFDWRRIDGSTPDDAAAWFQDILMELLIRFIPRKTIQIHCGAHPWFDDFCLDLVRKKRLAWGTPGQFEASLLCSQGLLQRYRAFISLTKSKLRAAKRGSKSWWKISKQLMLKSTSPSSIPALRCPGSSGWALSPADKADLLADTFVSKWHLPDPVLNLYSYVPSAHIADDIPVCIRARHAGKFLATLDVFSATGPDDISARVLRQLSGGLELPFAKLARCIVNCGRWPAIWTVHWICALYKRHAMSNPENYRGLQLTAQISKAMERYLASLFLPQLISVGAFGANQFAYRPGHGARDAILFLVLSWILLIATGHRVGVYCSDVSGAFDKVPAARLMERLRLWNVHPRFLLVLESWLRSRRARVVVGGSFSKEIVMQDMVYQGTVWGPSLWNTFFADSASVLKALSFSETVYADDLNAFKAFLSSVSNDVIFSEINAAQHELHRWGQANQVSFDAGKESKHILSRTQPAGPDFKMLGVVFDTKLLMTNAISECVTACNWKITSILRTKIFFTDAELVLFFKSHILSFIEYRTPAIYHAAHSHISQLDRVYTRFLRQVNVAPLEALFHFGLAPLSTRRDIAMLGTIHRAILGQGPKQLHSFFFLEQYTPVLLRHRHSRHAHDLCRGGLFPDYFCRSAHGLVAVYNLLPDWVVRASSVKIFQGRLQRVVDYLATTGYAQWASCLNRSTLSVSVLPRIDEDVLRYYSRLRPVRRLRRA